MAESKKKKEETITKKSTVKESAKKDTTKKVAKKDTTKKKETLKPDDKKVTAKKSTNKKTVEEKKKGTSKKKVEEKKQNISKKSVKKEANDDEKIISISTKVPKTKNKAQEKSRQANSKKHNVTARRRKRDATKIIPVDKILAAQRKLDEEELTQKQTVEIIKNPKKAKIKSNSKKKKKNNENKIVSIFNSIKAKVKDLFDFSSFSPKTRKVLSCIVFVCVGIIVIECIYLLVLKNTVLRGTYYDTLNSMTLDGSDMIVVGSSDFKYSKENKYLRNTTKAKLLKYDKNGNIMFEKVYDKGINSTYNDIISTNDGYIAVGNYTKDSDQAQNNCTDAIIVKYNKKGKKLWSKTFTSLSNSRFNKVIEVEDGYVVIGQSIYANMEMGNSTEGGGVILKYSKDGELLWKTFHGGTKSGSFNGIVEVNGWLYVVGRDGTDFGNIVQFNANGVYQWHKNYRYTDTLGLSDIVYKNGKLYAVGSKEIFNEEVTDDTKRNTTNTDALLICFDLDGDIEFEKTFGGSSYERFNSIVVYRNELVAVGSSSSSDSGLKIFTDGEKTTGILVKYDLDGSIENKMTLGGSNTDNLTSVITDNSNLYITGYTLSKDGNISTKRDNGKDYFGRLIKLDSRLHVLYLK